MQIREAKVRQILRRSDDLDRGHYAIGIEVLPHRLMGAVVTSDGTLAALSSRGLTDMQPDKVVEKVAAMARSLANDRLGLGFSRNRLCLGIQVGGPVDPDVGTVIHLVNGPDDRGSDKPPYEWREYPLGPELMAATGWATVVENDAQSFAAYEQKLGVGQHTATFAVILIRDGVGAALVMGRERVAAPVEFGHLRVWTRGRTCDCGMRGCIESQVGNRALTAAVKENTHRPLDGLEAAIDLANSNDPKAQAARAAFRKAGISIARGIASLLTIFSPSHVVLYAAQELIAIGPKQHAATSFLRAVHTFAGLAFPECRNCELTTKPLDSGRGAHGAALIALQKCFGYPIQPR